MAFCHSGTLFRLPVVNVAMSLEALLPVDPCRLPYPLPWSHRNGHMVSGGGGARCDITKGPALPGPQSPGASADQCTRSHFLSAHHMVPQMVPVLFHGCYLCLHLNVYFSWEKAEELQGKVLWGEHFLIWQNLPEHAQDCLAITLFWLFFIVLMYITLKLAGACGESNVQTPSAHPGSSLGSPGKRKRLLQQRLYVRYLNPAQDGPCETCVQCTESETRHGNRR